MNRFHETDCRSIDDIRSLALRMHPQGRRRLRLGLLQLRSLQRRLDAVRLLHGDDEALRYLKGESDRIRAGLQAVGGERGLRLPACGGEVRILALGRALVSGGEAAPEMQRMLEGVRAFDAVQELTMLEIQCMPLALNIALCEALNDLAGDVLRAARWQKCAGEWVKHGGRRGSRGNKNAEFWAQALRLCSEWELPEMHARALRIIDRNGMRPDLLVEQAHRIAADRCLRLNHLLQLRRLLEETDWEACFVRLSAAEQELRADPVNVYARMDAPSRACIRECTAELAENLRVSETAVARYALRAARDAARQHGPADPRASLCWYLAEDEGRYALRKELGARGRLKRRIPDPGGRRSVALVLSVTALLLALMLGLTGRPLLMLYALPLAWEAAQQIIGRGYPRHVKPARILKLKMDGVPDHARTLVVLPVLLSCPDRARQMIDHMEALGCLEQDPNIDYLLLGDFRDADSPRLPDDGDILRAAREGVKRLNEGAERHKYHYLHRERQLRSLDERWMGANRKRGALMALNDLLLGVEDEARAFSAEGGDAATLAQRHYRYVVTLDADTEYLPGTLRRLIGAMEHPLNRPCLLHGRRRGYAVLQPRMQLLAEACTNAWVRLCCGEGGMDSYPVTLSDFYQDLTGRGCFAGKGIYDVRAFAQATCGVLNDDAILSHDLIEGILAGAGSLNDVCFYDGCPESLASELKRLNRWTRGDWQLLPVLSSRMRIAAVDRMKMLGNLLRSLFAPALLGLLIHSVWLDAPFAFALGLLLAFREALFSGSRTAWKRALFMLAVLPAYAACSLDAVLRTLWRLAFSRRHLMDWVTAADAGDEDAHLRLPGRIAVILLLPGMLNPFWVPAVLALGLLFFTGTGWARELERTRLDVRGPLTAEQAALLLDLARKTWRFFETHVPGEGCGLPPDNVQLDPPAGVAMRTSPTNIGLYLMSCLAAGRMGFISRAQMLQRMQATLVTLEGLEKWQGQLYNWYDLNDLKPLRPRYVSAVDSGNLAGALLLCARELMDEPLGPRFQALAEGMNLSALYDAGRKLFFIGMDAENGRMSQAHYDLYASEARILSFSAMMLGQVEADHWRRLSRAAVRSGGNQALLSWSGTMFEYLMPELLLRCPDNTLAGESRRAAVACQMRQGRMKNRPWGVSESGYYAFDLQLNYQYRAFGLRSLALSPDAAQDVVAPYASALALMVHPSAAAQNLQRMCELGLCGELGLYEAADYQDPLGRMRIVRSHMAHHQGMTLCAICNLLCDDALSRSFMNLPRARALRILLQEKRGMHVRLRRRQRPMIPVKNNERIRSGYERRGRREACAADTHLLHGKGTTALVTARGGVFAWREGWQMNRFFGDLTSGHEGMYVHLSDPRTGKSAVIGSAGKCIFDAGSARFIQGFRDVQAELTITISPEDGALYQRLCLENRGAEACELEITGCLAVALAPEKDMRAHPVFQNLFVQSRMEGGNALVFRRRRREPGTPWPQLVYALAGAPVDAWETSLEKLIGRTGSLGGEIRRELTGSLGCTLNPCAALRAQIRLQPRQRMSLHFALALLEEGNIAAGLRNMAAQDAPERARQLNCTQTRAMLGFAGVDEALYHLLQRCGALIQDARLRSCVMQGDAAMEWMRRESLWSAGISGDLPILLVEMKDLNGMDCVREALRMHAFYRMMGVKMDFVVVNGHGSDYLQPARGALGDLIASSHLSGSLGTPGGAFVLERSNLNDASLAALNRAAALHLDSSAECGAQLRILLDGLHLRAAEIPAPMLPGHIETGGAGLQFFNGYGGFDERGYVILLRRGNLPPAPWSNVIAAEHCGAIVTERGGGYAWSGNSRFDRLTPFANDPLREGWGWMFYLLDERKNSYVRLLPGDVPMTDFTVHHAPGSSRWISAADDLAFELELHAENDGLHFDFMLENRGDDLRHLRMLGLIHWLMGTDGGDAGLVRSWSRGGACFASGAARGVGVFASDDPQARPGCDLRSLYNGGDMMQPQGLDGLHRARGGWTLHQPLLLRPGERRACRFLLGCGADASAALALARDFQSGASLRRRGEDWDARLEKLRIFTPDAAVNLLANGFLQAQTLNARIRGRTGLYQGGGAYGFRDQLQDMLPMIHYEPRRVRAHLLRCAARQFEAGDVLHWWHEPYTGVRTRISDDLLFLPYVTAQYVTITGDSGILAEEIPFLEEIEIPEDREDIYAQMQPSERTSSLHDHCMRALRRAAKPGEHGLCTMGSGDWNDGMNRVGARGRGESIWLSQFLVACARDYARISPSAQDRVWLEALEERLRAAIEEQGWDGTWYLRAYADDGTKLGSRGGDCCRIDLICQAWSVLAGLDAKRSRSAMDAAWNQLADERLGVIQLLTPPFDGRNFDPGYIAAYPPGVRENGAQYTHAACWMLLALIHQGDAARAHEALHMLLPVNHALDRRAADVYRVEPYVMAADIYTGDENAGRGGWSWYTGSSAWMLMAILALLGYERRGRRVRLNALLHTWPEAGVQVKFGRSRYTLICRKGVEKITLDGAEIQGGFIEMADDGREHTALFPPRKAELQR